MEITTITPSRSISFGEIRLKHRACSLNRSDLYMYLTDIKSEYEDEIHTLTLRS